MNTIGSLSEITSKTFDQCETKTLFCITKPLNTAAAISGLKYTLEMHVQDIINKKEKSPSKLFDDAVECSLH